MSVFHFVRLSWFYKKFHSPDQARCAMSDGAIGKKWITATPYANGISDKFGNGGKLCGL